MLRAQARMGGAGNNPPYTCTIRRTDLYLRGDTKLLVIKEPETNVQKISF